VRADPDAATVASGIAGGAGADHPCAGARKT